MGEQKGHMAGLAGQGIPGMKDMGIGDVLDDDYGDYEEQVDMLLRTIMEKEERVKNIEKTK